MKRWKQWISLLLCLVMVCGLLPTSAFASEAWSGMIGTCFAGGSGTKEAPYLIENGEQLAYFSKVINDSQTTSDYYSCFYKITADIDMNNYPFTPVSSFGGTLDGANHRISNFYIEAGRGMIQDGVGCTVQNLTLAGEVNVNDRKAGAFIGALNNSGQVINCVNECTIKTAKTNYSYIGGLVGTASESYIINCANSAIILAEESIGVGGIVGAIYHSTYNITEKLGETVLVSQCFNNGAVKGRDYIGGIAGYLNGSTVSQCANTGTVTALNLTAGGIAGDIYAGHYSGSFSDSYIANCYNAGKITAWQEAGGIAGRDDRPLSAAKGQSEICKVYNVGRVTAGGSTVNLSPIGCSYGYYLSDLNPDAFGPGIACTDSQMRSETCYVGFDFSSVWTWDKTGVYPYPILRTVGTPQLCDHANTELRGGQDATCVQDGKEADLVCVDCGAILRVGETLSAKGHTYVDGICADCGEKAPGYEVPDENAAKLVVGTAQERAGKMVTVPISMENNPGVVSVYLDVFYDTGKLKLIEARDTGLLKDPLFSKLGQMPFALNWDDSAAKVNNIQNGTIAYLTFEILEDCEIGKIPVALGYTSRSILDKNLQPVPFAAVNGYVDVVDYRPGDVNWDGEIDAMDVALLRRFLATGDSVVIFRPASDVNQDGKIDAVDVAMLRRYLAHWDDVVLSAASMANGLPGSFGPAVSEMTPQIIVSGGEAEVGEQVTVTVSLKNNPGIVSAYLDLDYDTTKLKLLSATDAGLLDGNRFDDSLVGVPFGMTWDASVSENNTANGVLAELTFEVLDGCEGGTAEISIQYPKGIINYDLEYQDFTVVNGTVSVKRPPACLIEYVDHTDDTVSVKLSNQDAGTCVAALYDRDGRLIAAATERVEANAGTVELLLSVTERQLVSGELRVFLLDENARPMSAPLFRLWTA